MTTGNILPTPFSLALDRDRVITRTVREQRDRLLGFIRKRVPNEQDAEDLVQDVFLQFANTYDMVNPIRQATSWLFTVARNKVIDFYRKKRNIPFSALAMKEDADGEEVPYLEEIYFSDSDNPADELLRQTVWEEFSAGLAELPEEQQQVFIWHELEGKSFKEIAELTGEPVNTLLSRKRYAVLRLRERLQHVYSELLQP